MATVRIYKVAELLNTSSQEVIALLKRDHGIEVKSASSTIEEVVARQFVERLARQRNITVPSNASFADTPVAVKGRKPAGKAPEPVKMPSLPPPRLVKTAKPATPAVPGDTGSPVEPERIVMPPPADPVPFIPEPVPAGAAAVSAESAVEEPPAFPEPEPVEAAPPPVQEKPAAAAAAVHAPSAVVEEPSLGSPAPEAPAPRPTPSAPRRLVV